MKRLSLVGLFAAIFLSACGGPSALEVRPYHLREIKTSFDDDPLIRAEERRRLHGAIGVREQEQRLGQYYTVLWNDAKGVGTGEARVVFEYQQAATASKVLRMEESFDAGEKSGKAEFGVVGEAYLKGGRVLAWRCRLFRGDQQVGERHSYLWE